MDLIKKADFYKALSQEVRLWILDFLLKGPNCICKISEHVKKDQSVVFRHIQILKKAGIIETYKVKSSLYCKINSKEKTEKLLI